MPAAAEMTKPGMIVGGGQTRARELDRFSASDGH
jgi:hypothetical protein